MKKKTALLTLVLSLAMVLTSISSVFAAAPPTDETKAAITEDIQSMTSLKDEVSAESFAKALADQVVEGKYKLMDTAELKTRLDNKLDDKKDNDDSMVIVDTMPPGWYSMRHIPTAINQVVGGNGTAKAPKYEISDTEGTDLLAKVNAAVPKKSVVKYQLKKNKKKYITAAKYKKLSKKNKKKYKKVTVKEPNKAATVVVYCGFTKCQRSHQAAMYLKKKGFTNVYRYAGGITAWVESDFDIEGKDIERINFPELSDEDWAAYGIDAGEVKNTDYIIDVRPDAQREANGFVPGAKIIPVAASETTPDAIVNADAFQEAIKEAAGKRIVVVCVSGNKLAKNALNYLQYSYDNITYLKGGFNGSDAGAGWAATYPVVSPDKTSVSVPAWVSTQGKGTDGKIAMVELVDEDGKGTGVFAEDLTHHLLVNENGSNAPSGVLNTKAMALQVYTALKEIGGSPYDQFNSKDQTDEYSLAGKGSAINVSFVYDGDKTATMSDFFKHVVTPTADVKKGAEIETEDYVADMRFGGGLKNIEDNIDSVSGNLTGCITCTFSCWIGTVSNGNYEYSTQEAMVNRDNVPAAGTPVTVVYTLGE